MNKLKTLLLFSILISFKSYGEWTELFPTNDGNTLYIGLDTIKEHNGYIYYWDLTDLLKPYRGWMSYKGYNQVDCGKNRSKILSAISYKQPMGKGANTANNNSTDWGYIDTQTIGGYMSNYVCEYVK